MEGWVQCRALSLMGMAQKCVEFERMVPSWDLGFQSGCTIHYKFTFETLELGLRWDVIRSSTRTQELELGWDGIHCGLWEEAVHQPRHVLGPFTANLRTVFTDTLLSPFTEYCHCETPTPVHSICTLLAPLNAADWTLHWSVTAPPSLQCKLWRRHSTSPPQTSTHTVCIFVTSSKSIAPFKSLRCLPSTSSVFWVNYNEPLFLHFLTLTIPPAVHSSKMHLIARMCSKTRKTAKPVEVSEGGFGFGALDCLREIYDSQVQTYNRLLARRVAKKLQVNRKQSLALGWISS